MTTVAEIFEAMPTIFNSAAAAGMTKTFQWNITGEQAGVWAFKVHDGFANLPQEVLRNLMSLSPSAIRTGLR